MTLDNDGALRWGAVKNLNIRSGFSASRIDARSFTSTPIIIYCDGLRLGHASGFFWKRGSEKWLITNWHVVTGNNPFTRRALACGQPPPTNILVYDTAMTRVDVPGDWQLPEKEEIKISLFDGDGLPVWKQHKNFDDLRIDIVAIPLRRDCSSSKPECVNECGHEQLFHMIGSDAFVVGYPLDNFEGWMLPIWKRGSLASEPLIPVDGKPVFLLDIASSRGMSGSAVFRRVYGPRVTPDLSEVNLMSVLATEFVGVYSGRLDSKEHDRVNLAYAWYGYLIDEILLSGCVGSTC